MKKFIANIILFSSILFVTLIGLSINLPVHPRVKNSLLFSKIRKDELLRSIESPRIIFIGGSNLSFGIDSQAIQDSLRIYPINTAVQASIGLVFMMDSTLPYVIAGDIIIISPEYEQFFGYQAYGAEPLFRTIMDVSLSDWKILGVRQWLNIVEYFPEYVFSKVKRTETFQSNPIEDKIYGISSFNEYGDAVAHRGMEPQEFLAIDNFPGEYNPNVIKEIIEFANEIEEKGALLCISFPGFQIDSFENTYFQISKVEEELRLSGLCVLGTSERYAMPNSYMFNTPYHLNIEGIKYRTSILIEDINKLIQIQEKK